MRTRLDAMTTGTLQDIEYRIHLHLQAAYTNVLEVGRCLIEAKQSGLVPYGEWEAWVRKNAQMSERAAQRLMQAAREVKPGTVLSELPISQIQEILALPEPQREAMAERAKDEDMTVKELREAIARERKRSDQMIKKYNDASARVRTMEQEHEKDVQALRLQLDEARRAPKGMSPEARREIDRLQAELEEAEAQAARQAELRQQAQQALIEQQSRQARGDLQREDLTADSVVVAVRTFVGTVGYLPHSTQVMQLSPADRQLVMSHVAMIRKWADGMADALKGDNIVVIEEATV